MVQECKSTLNGMPRILRPGFDGTQEDVATLQPWGRAWSQWTSASFLAGYLEKAPPRIAPNNDGDLQLLLEFFLLEKCVYEIGYELDNRPEWVEIPLRGLLALLPEPT